MPKYPHIAGIQTLAFIVKNDRSLSKYKNNGKDS